MERIRSSKRFVDGVFRNTSGVGPGLQSGSTLSTMGAFFFGGERRTPLAPLPSESPLERWATEADTGLRVTWLGHSTVLIELDGMRVLTDPVWGERASPWSFAGPKRFQPVPAPIAALPKLDAVIVSHDHYDHLDYPTIVELAKQEVPFFTSLGVGAHLEKWGVPPERITELDWWESVQLRGGKLQLTAAPAQHFSGRAMGDRNATLWSSFAIKSDRHQVFFSGDTGLTEEYAEIRQRLGAFDVVMLEVGAYHPSWGHIHLGPENALKALELIGGGALLPVHWGTFNLAIHAWDDPAETLVRQANQTGARLLMPKLGVAVEPARVDHVDPWWRAVSELDRSRQPRRDEPARPPC